jgi:hypothetical protein
MTEMKLFVSEKPKYGKEFVNHKSLSHITLKTFLIKNLDDSYAHTFKLLFNMLSERERLDEEFGSVNSDNTIFNDSDLYDTVEEAKSRIDDIDDYWCAIDLLLKNFENVD